MCDNNVLMCIQVHMYVYLKAEICHCVTHENETFVYL